MLDGENYEVVCVFGYYFMLGILTTPDREEN
jgi:hypothetical protein